MLVAGAGISGLAAAAALVELGARVTVPTRTRPRWRTCPTGAVAGCGGGAAGRDAAGRHRSGPPARPPARRRRGGGRGPGDRRAGAGLVDRGAGCREPPVWLVVTGTNGKTTTTGMLEAILRAAGLDAVACGNIGYPVVDAVRAGRRVLAVELSSFQLHWSPSVVPAAGCVLNVAEDHLDWHGSMAAYAAAKARALRGPVAVAGVDDPAGGRAAGRVAGGAAGRGDAGGARTGAARDRRATCWSTGRSRRVRTERKRRWVSRRSRTPLSLDPDGRRARGRARPGRRRAPGRPARAHRRPRRRRAGPRRRRRARARRGRARRRSGRAGTARTWSATVAGVRYVDDSKATNPHAAAASLAAQAPAPVVWMVGGLLKGASVDELVAAARRGACGRRW